MERPVRHSMSVRGGGRKLLSVKFLSVLLPACRSSAICYSRSALSAICYLLSAICYLLSAICYLLFAKRPICYSRSAANHQSPITCHLSSFTIRHDGSGLKWQMTIAFI
jgi:ribosomal protein S27E